MKADASGHHLFMLIVLSLACPDGITSMFERIFLRSLIWTRLRLGSRTFLVLASILVGIVSALAAIVLKTFVHYMHMIPDYFFRLSNTHIWYILMPVSGILLTVLVVRFFFKGKLERGLGSILYAIARKSSKVERSKMYSHVVTSGITIGFGGSAGLEAPIVITGSAIGSNIATALKLGYKERTLLLACGAASGIAAVFNSPIAGVVFAIEVLLTDVSIATFIPLLISTATAVILSKLSYSGQIFYLITNQWFYHAIPYYVLLGVLCGLISVYMTRATLFLEGFFEKRKKIYSKAIWGGLLLGAVIFVFPPLYGEGYTSVSSLLNGDYYDLISRSVFASYTGRPWILFTVTVAIVILKVIATSLTNGSGGNGGIFAPSLFTGAVAGFSLAFFVNFTGISTLHISNFVAVGMAGIMSGVVHAPLTSIFLIAEITGGYVLFIPLMIVSALSFFISRYFEPYTIYTKNLARRGHMFTDDKEGNILIQLRLDEMIETDFTPLRVSNKLRDVIEAFTASKRHVFPVVDDQGVFIGVIDVDDIKSIMFKPEEYDLYTVGELTDKKILTIDKSEVLASAVEKFETSNLWYLPVVDGNKYMGFISRANLLSYYRRILKRSSSVF
jgi:CIC family chloride channel protein